MTWRIGCGGLLVDIWNVSNRVARLSANLEPILEFGIVPIAGARVEGKRTFNFVPKNGSAASRLAHIQLSIW
jgi:hypothetical protein